MPEQILSQNDINTRKQNIEHFFDHYLNNPELLTLKQHLLNYLTDIETRNAENEGSQE